MSQELSTKQKSEIIFSLVGVIETAKKNIATAYLVIGEALSKINKGRFYASYCDHINNFDDFLKEITFKRSTAYNLIAIWDNFGSLLSNRLDIPEYTRLVHLLPVVNEENKEELIEKANSLAINDFEDEVRILKGRTSRLDCSHKETESWVKCKSCQKWLKRK